MPGQQPRAARDATRRSRWPEHLATCRHCADAREHLLAALTLLRERGYASATARFIDEFAGLAVLGGQYNRALCLAGAAQAAREARGITATNPSRTARPLASPASPDSG